MSPPKLTTTRRILCGSSCGCSSCLMLANILSGFSPRHCFPKYFKQNNAKKMLTSRLFTFFSSLLHFLILVDTFRNQERRSFYWASMTSPTVNTTFSISLSYKYVLGRQARPEVINCIINQETKEIAIQVTIHCTADMATVAPAVSESRRSHPIILTNKVLDHPLYYSSRSACSVNKRTVAKDPSEVPFAYQ